MNEFIGNHIKFIAEWGQILMASFILFSIFLLYLLGRKHKYFLPNGIFSWIAGISISLFIILSSLVFARITQIKPGVASIINQFEELIGKEAPPLTFESMEDATQKDIRDFRGKVILLNYWATWCKPCLKEMPDLNQLHKDFHNKGFTVLAITDEKKVRVQNYEKKAPFEAQIGLVKAFNWVDLGSERPASFIIDREGLVREYFTGPYSYDFFSEKIYAYLDR